MIKRTIRKILVIGGLIINLGISNAAIIEVSGDVSGTWLSGNTYVITSTATVPNGASLTIEPGVIVRFATDTSLISYGVLMAVGTPDGTITFSSNKPTPQAGDWRSIKLSGNGANGSQISYCLIQYGKQALYLENVSNVIVTHNIIRENKGNKGQSSGEAGEVGCGIYLSSSATNTITGNSISQNIGGVGETGQYGGSGGEGGIGCGIYISLSRYNIISGNAISQNTGGQGGNGGSANPGGIGGRGGIGCGIYLSSSVTNIITENSISQNAGGQGGSGGYNNVGGIRGIGCGIYLSSSATNTITGNSISQSTGENGYGIYIDSNSYNNIIDSSNTYNGESIHYYYGITTPTIIENQTLTLAGSGSTNLGRIVLINCQFFTIKNNIITGGIGQNAGPGGSGGIGCGIYLSSSTNNTITNNTISQNIGGRGGNSGSVDSGGSGGIGCGIYLSSSTNNTITRNSISHNIGGLGGIATVYGSNGVPGNGYGIYIDSNSYNNIIDSSNTYNGESIHYYYGITTPTIIENQTLTLAGSGSTNLGRIVLINCQFFTIKNNIITGGIGQNAGPGGSGGIGWGIYLSSSFYNTILENTILQNRGGKGITGGFRSSGGSGGIGCGIYLFSSGNNTISGNFISQATGGEGGRGGYTGSDGAGGIGYGIYLDSSNDNIIRDNTIKENVGGSGNPKGNGIGIYCKSSLIGEFIYNNIYNNQTYNLQTDISPGTQTAEYNWWGADPPATYTFSGNIDYDPWLTSSVLKITIVPLGVVKQLTLQFEHNMIYLVA